MPTPFWTRVIIVVAAAMWFGIALLLDAPVDATWLKPAGFVTAAVVLLMVAFDTLLWRLLPLRVTKRPILRGTWRAELTYRWPPEAAPTTKPCYLLIRQNFSTVSVRMFFDISSSESRSADISVSDGQYRLWWTYLSMAEQFDRDNPMHRGAAEVAISVSGKTTLEGQYWTERQTVGRITAYAHSRKFWDSFAKAEHAKFDSRKPGEAEPDQPGGVKAVLRRIGVVRATAHRAHSFRGPLIRAAGRIAKPRSLSRSAMRCRVQPTSVRATDVVSESRSKPGYIPEAARVGLAHPALNEPRLPAWFLSGRRLRRLHESVAVMSVWRTLARPRPACPGSSRRRSGPGLSSAPGTSSLMTWT